METSRGDAAAATRTFRGDESRRRRGRDADVPRREVAPWTFRGEQVARLRYGLARGAASCLTDENARFDETVAHEIWEDTVVTKM